MSAQTRIIRLIVIFAVCVASARSIAAEQQTVTLFRDSWGVPHVYAETAAAGAYGLGYAQAEDRLSDVFVSLRTGMGTMSEVFGPEFVEHDYLMRLCRNAELARNTWSDNSQEVRELVEHFAAGIRGYAAEHPDEVPPHAMEWEPWMLLTIGRAMILRWPLGTIRDDLSVVFREHTGQGRPRPPTRSNAWVVSPERSADRVPILLADPHLTWEGLAVLYEARVHAGDLHMNGFFLIGSPVMGIGHNRHVGWALTTGGPDTADVYEMKFRLKPSIEYEYDGAWRPAEIEQLTIPVKGGEPVLRTAVHTHLGPVMWPAKLEEGRAYVGAAPLLERTGLLNQFYRMAVSTSSREFFDAIGMGEFNQQNIMFADVHGDVGYVRSGATPIRNGDYNWNAPVPGNTSQTAWQGIHPVEDLVHIFNPPQGCMQNCNISPENMMADSPLTRDKYRDYIYNVSWDTSNPRSVRSRALLDVDTSVTRDEAIAYAMDVYDVLAERWQGELRRAVDAAGEEALGDEPYAAAVRSLLDWDGRFTRESRVTPLYKMWRLKCGAELDLSPLARGEHLGPEQQAGLVRILRETLQAMVIQYGRWDVAWGDIHRVGRGGKFFPVGGADFRAGNKEANFSETLFNVRSVEDANHPGRFIANNGSMAMLLMFFHRDGIESLSCTPWGQSGHPESEHYMDQGEKLYSPRRMKETWWDRADLMPHVESKRELTVDLGRPSRP